MKVNVLKLKTVPDCDLIEDIKQVQNELDSDSLMHPISHARYEELMEYKNKLQNELNRRNEGVKV